MINRKRRTCRNNNRLHTQPFWTPLRLRSMMFLRVYLICASLDFLLYLLYHSALLQKWHLELNVWLWPWPQHRLKDNLKDDKTWWQIRFNHFDLELWPTTLTYNPNPAKVKVDPHATNEGHRSNGSSRRAQTDKKTNKQMARQTDATKRIISPASR